MEPHGLAWVAVVREICEVHPGTVWVQVGKQRRDGDLISRW